MSQRKILATVRQCTWAEWVLLAEACWSLGMARCAVHLRPFRYIAAGLGTPMTESPTTDVGAYHAAVAQISWAVLAVSRRIPWTSQCLVQALAAKWMLQRRRIPSTMYFGIAKDATGQLIAHAWLRSGSQILTGSQGRQQFTVVATFAET
jgi:Transglutaminase-like superfamily